MAYVDLTSVAIVSFLFINAAYLYRRWNAATLDMFIDKPNEKGDMVSGAKTFAYSEYFSMVIYYVIVVAVQFGINIGSLMINCPNGSKSNNVVAAVMITFIPWALIFASMIVILILFPGFKTAFSNVIGYYVVAGSADTLLKEMLVDTNIESIKSEDKETQTKLRNTAETILKICGNVSVFINQISPSNFTEYWELLTPLMKPGQATDDNKLKLLSLSYQRDKIGEVLWLIYTGILVISYTQFKLAAQPCVKTPEQMQADQASYIAAQTKQDENTNDTVYMDTQ